MINSPEVIHKSNIPLHKKITPKDSVIYMGSIINTASKISKNKYIEETSSENEEYSYKD